MVIEAERAPTNAGAKVTEIVQLAPAATLLAHVLVWLKSERLVPVTPMFVMVKAAVPGFERVIVWAALLEPRFWLGNVRVGGLSEACATPTPVPLRAAV
jgi:hypothetical protein